MKKRAIININQCVACGVCMRKCPIGAIKILQGCYALVDSTKCVGCGQCMKACPASVIKIEEVSA